MRSGKLTSRSGAARLGLGQPFGQSMRPLGRVAGTEQNDRIALAAMAADEPHELARIVDQGHGRMAGGADAFGQRLLVDAVDGRFTSRVHGRDYDIVGCREAGGEITEQVAHARVAMRLDHGDDTAPGAGARRLQHGRDLGRVVAVVVIDLNAVPRACELEAPFDAGEAREP